MTTTSLEELADAADNAVAALTTRRTFEEARAALNEAGMLRARARIGEALQRIEDTQATLRAAHEVAGIRKNQLEQALVEAEWELDYLFVADGNKTYLVVGDERRAMTADERAKWKTLEARKDEAVRDMSVVAAGADSEVAFCRDALAVAEKGFVAARIDLDAAICTVQLFAASIHASKKEAV